MKSLYEPSSERDSCGIGFVAHIRGLPSQSIVSRALTLLENMSHRGAQGSDPWTGDGAGIMVQIPHRFLAGCVDGFELPSAGKYAVGMLFIQPSQPSTAHEDRLKLRGAIDQCARKQGLSVLGWRDVPVDPSAIGATARESQPEIVQVFLGSQSELETDVFERKLYLLRRNAEKELRAPFARSNQVYFASLSTRTIIYKGLLLPEQIGKFYVDLSKPDFESAVAMVHSRFSTNTFPAWELAQPFRYLCHNGEINTLQGNLNWMRARQGTLKSPLFGEAIHDLFPIISEGQSDSACLDNALEFLVRGGRSLPHSVMMLIPEPWQAHTGMDLDRRGFYEYHAAMMEPWDGPAAVCFTDGRLVGATLDRNGLRPCRYQIHRDETVVLASEAGALPVPPEEIVSRDRLKPGQMFLLDMNQGRILSDEEVKSEIARRLPFRSWVSADRISLDDLPEPFNVPQPSSAALERLQKAFGYTEEELRMVILPTALSGEEPTSSMGNDTPLAALSDRPQLLFKYFRQLFAQVTNPPIDPIRESLVMSLMTSMGPRPNLLQEEPGDARRIRVPTPILSNNDLMKIRSIADPRLKSKTLRLVFPISDGKKGLRRALLKLCRDAARAVKSGHRLIVLSDREVSPSLAPIPSLLGLAAVHHHLIRRCLRSQVGLVVETAEARDVHHFACLVGYGAGAINPYLVFESLIDRETHGELPEGLDAATAQDKYIKAVGKGLLKILSKMGISTLQSYCGAQIFECIGLDRRVVDLCFRGTSSRLGGATVEDIALDVLARHELAFGPDSGGGSGSGSKLDFGSEIHYRAEGEKHFWNPRAISSLQLATRTGDPKTYQEFSSAVNEDNRRTLRGLLEFQRKNGSAVPLSEVEPASEVVKRFTTGAMSFGALSKEAHETLAVAMNRIGAKSNSGEGGESADRFDRLANGDSLNSAIKQIASARFGVTIHYLVNARELQIKVAQGAKPGEGGQLPGYKVDQDIARLRHSTPGVTLISPPPHHDIYSIEDLKQLIFDLRNANPKAAISVKLVSEVGVGTVAAGVAKAHANKILISGDSGGTGASPLSSIKYAGIPWEVGLAEAHQTLVLNGLRDRVKLETDGQLKNGRDVAIAALLGAQEFGFSTAPLIVEGCIMMRKCHLNTCPVGVATQDPELRKKFTGQPEHVINYFFFVAEELRGIMAELGFRSVGEMVGRSDCLRQSAEPTTGLRRHRLDLTRLLVRASGPAHARPAEAHLDTAGPDFLAVLDQKLFESCRPALEKGEAVSLTSEIRNTDRATGAFISGRIVEKHGPGGLPDGLLKIAFRGSAGQSFGAFLAPGVSFRLDGEANDYVGKGLSGGSIAIVPPTGLDGVLIGNTCLYGATSGELFVAGIAGERFAVRNSGAFTVVEGTGDHGCEYMTGGQVIVLGPTGRNFAAGMSGGVAYVLDEDQAFSSRCNLAQVQLETLESEKEREALRCAIARHLEKTGSPKADRILKSWPEHFGKFVKVMPTEYKRVLEEQAERARLAVAGVEGVLSV